MFAQMLDLRLQFETIRDLRSEIVRNIAETKRRLLDVETRQSETVREVCALSFVNYIVVIDYHFCQDVNTVIGLYVILP